MPVDVASEPVDVLRLGDHHALAVYDRDGALSAVPLVDEGRGPHRATAGSGAATALLHLIAAAPGRTHHGRFDVVSWSHAVAEGPERSVAVDQTNESVIVGDDAVVKWSTHLEPGPHPAPGRLSALIDAGFDAMPPPRGVITWTPDHGAETLVATVTGYVAGAVDGWTWAVDMVSAAAASGDLSMVTATSQALGVVVADLHLALDATVDRSTPADARRWRDIAFDTLAAARGFAVPATAAVLEHNAEMVERTLSGLADLIDVPILAVHGDLHVGQILRAGDRLLINDFDGNPVLTPADRVRPAPAAVDVAGLLQSVAHVAIVAARHHDLDPTALRAVDAAARAALYDAYAHTLARSGRTELLTTAALPALRLQQVLREIVYAAQHLPRWMYVPDAALPALIDEMSR